MSLERPDAAVEELERELQRALAIEPSPEFAQRVRVRVSQASANAGRDLLRRVVPLAGAAACAFAVAIGWQVARDSSDAPAAAIATRVASDVQLSPQPVAIARTGARRSDARRPPRAPAALTRVRSTGPAAPEAIVPPDRAEGLARLLALARSGVVSEQSLPAVLSTAVPAELEVAPLVIPPIAVPDIETGNPAAPGGDVQQ